MERCIVNLEHFSRNHKKSLEFLKLGYTESLCTLQMKLSNSTKPQNQSFASFLLAFSLFGLFWQDHVNPPNRHHDVNLVKPSEVQQIDEWMNGFYKPTQSPGFHDDFGS